jgi:hypothetical protein
MKIVRHRGPPTFVATHPGSSALDLTSVQWRATPNADKISHSLLSAYADEALQDRLVQSRSSIRGDGSAGAVERLPRLIAVLLW